MPAARIPRGHVVVVGSGGNIGSHVVPHLARLPQVTRLTLVDPDTYETHNKANQAIDASAVGKAKVVVQAREVRRVNPHVQVVALQSAVEDVALGVLRGDVILSCLDSRGARQHVNVAARRLGVPWLDAGVLADDLLARLDLYVPQPGAPCLECAWSAADYEAIEQEYACQDVQYPATLAAPSALGGVAAALQALECARLLHDPTPTSGLRPGEQVVLSVEHHRHFRTQRRLNAACRLADHGTWDIEPLDLSRRATLGVLIASVARRMGAREAFALLVFGRHFARRPTCPRCGAAVVTLHLTSATARTHERCPRCRQPMLLSGFGRTESLAVGAVPPRERHASLRAVGFRAGDVLTADTGADRRHFEIRGDAQGHGPAPVDIHAITEVACHAT